MPFRTGEEAIRVAQDRAILSLGGLEKLGKTFFAFTAPPPIFYVNMGDFGYREALTRALELEIISAGMVHIADHPVGDEIGFVPPMPDADATKAVKDAWLAQSETNYKVTAGLLKGFRTDWLAANEQADKAGGTVVIDPATKLWQLVTGVKVYEAELKRARMWRRDSRADVEPDRRDYGLANSYMEGLIGRPFMYDSVNALFILRSQNVYDTKGVKTTATETVGFKFMPAIVQASLQLIEKPGTKRIVAHVDSCRFDREKRGIEIEAPDWDSVTARLQA